MQQHLLVKIRYRKVRHYLASGTPVDRALNGVNGGSAAWFDKLAASTETGCAVTCSERLNARPHIHHNLPSARVEVASYDEPETEVALTHVPMKPLLL